MLRTVQNHVPQPGSLFRRQALEIAPLDEAGYYYFDFQFVATLGARGRAARLEQTLAGYRLHDVSKSMSAPYRKGEDLLRTIDAIFALPDLPSAVRAIENESRSAGKVTAAEYFYAAGCHRDARSCLLRAGQDHPRVMLSRRYVSLLLRFMLPPSVTAWARELRRRRGLLEPSAPN